MRFPGKNYTINLNPNQNAKENKMARSKQTARSSYTIPSPFVKPPEGVINLPVLNGEELAQQLHLLSTRRTTPYPPLPPVFELKRLLTEPETAQTEVLSGKKRVREDNTQPPAKRSIPSLIFDDTDLVTVNHLPTEIWKLIIDVLDDKGDTASILQMSFVNHTLRKLCLSTTSFLKHIYLRKFSPIALPKAIVKGMEEEDEYFEETDEDRWKIELLPLSDDYLLAFAGNLVPDGEQPRMWWKTMTTLLTILERDYVAANGIASVSNGYEDLMQVFSYMRIYQVDKKYERSGDYIWMESQFVGFPSSCRPLHFLVRINEHPILQQLTTYAQGQGIADHPAGESNVPTHPCCPKDGVHYEVYVYNHKVNQWAILCRNTACAQIQEFCQEVSAISASVVDTIMDFPRPPECKNEPFGLLHAETLVDALVTSCGVTADFQFYNSGYLHSNWLEEMKQNYPHKVALHLNDTSNTLLRDIPGTWDI